MSGPVRVKICGLTRHGDVDAAVSAGASALGFVFAESPRKIDPELAAALADGVPSGILRVGLFMGHDRAAVRAILEQVPLDLLQFHGPVDNDFCRSFGLPFLKAVSVATNRARLAVNEYPDAVGILFDSPGPGGAGGTGRTFDWSLVRRGPLPVWLAGGLTPNNVARAIQSVRPDWVDVSSGVEQAPGIKSEDRIKAFLAAVRSAAPTD